MTKKTLPIKLPQKIKADYEHYCRQLHKWSVAYYQNNTSLVADEHYDKVLQKVIALEKAYPVLQTDDSPTQQVGSPVVQSHFQKHQHLYQMLSLSNIFAKDEIATFVTKTAAMTTYNYDLDYVGELKIDGLAISLEYENYELKTASTRGDGKVGEDVTLNVYAIKNIPHKIKVPRLVVRGEIYLSKKAFQHLNEIQQTKQEPLYANARNAAAGTLRNLNVAVVAERNLEAFFYDCHGNKNLTSQAELLSFLQEQGFCVNPHYQVLKNVAEMEHYATQQEAKRNQFAYAIDGVVFKLNQLEARSQVGVTSKFPK